MLLTNWFRRCWENRHQRRARRGVRGPRDGFARLRLTRLDERRVFAVGVVNAPANGSSNEGSIYTLPSATYQDTGTAVPSHTASVDWGDGSALEPIGDTEPLVAFGLGSTSAIAGHIYAEDGLYTVTITVTGSDGSFASDTLTVTVANVAPSVTYNGPTKVPLNGTIQLSATASDPGGAFDPLTFEWDLDGDTIFGETGAGATRGNEVGTSPTFNSAGLTAGTVFAVALQVSDDEGAATGISVNLTVNAPPTISVASTALTYAENAGGLTIDGALTAADSDSSTLSGAVVEITSGFQAGDQLSFTLSGGIAGSYNAGTGRLTLSGTASETAYRNVLRSVAFFSTSDDPTTATRTVTFTINDGLNTASDSRNIQVTVTNDAPTITVSPGSASFTEDAGSIIVDPTIAVADADNTQLTQAVVRIANYRIAEDLLEFTNQNGISGSWNAAQGVLTLTGTASVAFYQDALRSVRYQNTSQNPNQTTRTIQFEVDDGSLESVTVSRQVTVTAVNDAPQVHTLVTTLSYTENDPPITIDTILQISDDDSTVLSGAIVQVLNFRLDDRLTFTLTGGITGTYDAPNGILQLTGNASLADYQAVLRSVQFENTGENPFTQQRTIRFQVTDSTGVPSGVADVLVDVTDVNDAPAIAPIANVVLDRSTPIPVISVTLSDVDTPLNNLILQATSSDQTKIPDANIVVGGAGANRTLTITPAPGAFGIITITLVADDGTDFSQPVTFTIEINDPPTITRPADFAVNEDSPPVFVTVTVSDTETPLQNLVVTASTNNPTLVVVDVFPGFTSDTRDVKITFAPNLSGPVDITLRVSDGSRTTDVTFHVDVHPVNDIPIATLQTVTVREDNTIVITVTGDDGDPDKVEPLTFDFYIDPFFGQFGPFSGTIQHVAGSNTFIYTPGANFSGLDGFLFVVTDDGSAGSGGPLTSAPNWLFIDVTPVADAPTVTGPVGGIVAPEDTKILLSVLVGLTDTDGSESISNVTIDLVPADVFIVRPDGTHFVSSPGALGLKSYSLTYSDFLAARVYALDNGGGSLRVTVTASENVVPIIVGDQTASTILVVPLQFDNLAPRINGLSGTDVDVNAETTLTATIHDAPGDTFTVTITWGVSKIGFTQQSFLGVKGPGIASIVETFQFLIAPDPQNPAAPIQIIMEVRDDDGGVTTQTIVVQVAGTGIPTTIIREFGFTEVRTTVPFIVPPRPADARIWTTPYQPTSDFGRILSERVNVSTRSVLLRVVSARGVESPESYRLSASILANLPAFLQKLPDGHYRLYLSENEFTPERMLVDVVVFRGRAVAPGDIQADRPPNRKSPTLPFDSGDVPAALPAVLAEFAPREEPAAVSPLDGPPSDGVPAQAQRDVRRIDGPAVSGPTLGGKQDR